MPVQARIVQFLAVSAREPLLPDSLDKPLELARRFDQHFLSTAPPDKQELLREAQALSDAQVEEVADAVAAEWKVGLTERQRELVRQLTRCLRAAAQPAAGAAPAE